MRPIGLRMPQINVSGAYTYLGKDIGFDLNDLKAPAGNLAQQIFQSGLIPEQAIPKVQGIDRRPCSARTGSSRCRTAAWVS